MQCPNCHKEAINVNGKYVCLDCGIEIGSENNTAPTPPPAISPITNHSSEPTASDSFPAPAAFNAPDTEPIVTVPVSSDISTPVKDEIIQELNQNDSTGMAVPMDQTIVPDVTPDIGPKPVVPDFPSSISGGGVSAPEAPLTEVNETVTPLEINQQSPVASPVVVPDIPIVESSPPEKVEIEPQNTAVSAQPENPSVQPNPVLPDQNIPTPQVSINEEPKEPNYFQPQEMNIAAPQAPTVPANASFDALSTPSGVPSTEPMLDTLPSVSAEPIPAPDGYTPSPVEPAVAPQPIAPIPTIEPEKIPVFPQSPEQTGPSQNLDDLLDAYSVPQGNPSPNPVPQMPQVPQPQNSFDSVQGTMSQPVVSADPIPNNVPTYESTFGGPNAGGQNQAPIARNAGGLFANKKMLLIIGGAILGVLVIGGAIFGIMSLNKKAPAVENQEIINQELSTKIQNAMEGELNTEVTFKQTIDFSNISLVEATEAEATKTEGLNLLMKTPVDNKGIWKANTTGNTQLEATVGVVSDKEIYVKNDKATYVFNNATNAWDKKDGFAIVSVPSFYGAESRGKLFYTAQVDSFESLGKDEVDGNTFNKYKVKSNSDFIQSIISSSNPILSGVTYESLNTDALEILAWVDDEAKIRKVEVSGIVEVTSDAFTGPVTITSEATYKYKDDIKIEKPVAMSTVPIIAKSQPAILDEKDVEVIPVKTNVIKTTENSESKG